MADPFSISFPPITAGTILSGSFSFEPGVVPSAGSILCTSQTITQQLGTLTLTWSSPETGTKTIVIPDCKIEAIHQVDVDTLEVVFLDRRWRWRYGHIDGKYNVQTGDTTWEFEKTPKQLMDLCLDAMGESGYDTSQVISEEKIFVDWKGDVPAFCLAELCGMLGYVVTITAGNKVAIRRSGEGGPMPSNGTVGVQVLQAATGSVDDGHRPEKIRIAPAPVRYEVMFTLEAVGMQSDGEILPLADVDWFDALTTAQQESLNHPRWAIISDDEDRQLAQQTGFRWYRIKEMVGGGGANDLDPPGYLGTVGAVSTLDQLLPLLPHRNGTELPAGGSFKVPKPWYVEGDFYLQTDAEAAFNSGVGTKYPFGATLDTERGIVRFSDHVYLVESGTPAKIVPAEMSLVCCVEVRDPDNHQQQYYGWTWDAGGLSGAGILTIDREELVPEVTSTFSSGTLAGTSNNLVEIKAEAEKFAAATLRQLVPQARGMVQFAGFHPIATDGLIQQVTWSWGRSGPITRVSAGGPYGAGPSYRQKDQSAAAKRRLRAMERREKRANARAERMREASQ